MKMQRNPGRRKEREKPDEAEGSRLGCERYHGGVCVCVCVIQKGQEKEEEEEENRRDELKFKFEDAVSQAAGEP